MPPFDFQLVDDSPYAANLLISTMIVAIKSKAKLIKAHVSGKVLILTFDKDLSQSDIVHVLTEGLKE